ncbi:MAG: hypothetical protein ACE5EG_12640 [Thermoanaerobaculia bacterium]
MRLKLVITGVALVVAALAMAQTMEEPAVILEDDPDQPLAGQAELASVVTGPLELGADLGNSCICICRSAHPPVAERWGYYERSIVSNCQWTGRVCVVEGMLGTLGACTESPAPLD